MSKANPALVVHITSAHSANDIRIFRKECRSAVEAGFRVILVAPDAPAVPVDGVSFVSIPRASGRLARMTLGAWRAWRAARVTEADIFHVHDPELLPGALVMAWMGHRVVYDAHEDVAADLLHRDYLPGPLGKLIARVVGVFERAVAQRLTAVVAATPAIARRHRGARHVVTVANYPRREEFDMGTPVSYAERPRHVAYVGLISLGRGCREMLDTLALLRHDGVRLRLAGPFDPPSLQAEAEAHSAWDLVDYNGTIPYAAVHDLLAGTRAGLVLFLPLPNHVEAQPNKLFEYMAAGIPLIASDFPRWRELIADSGSGRLVAPDNPDAIAAAIRAVLADPVAAEAIGRRGMKAVRSRYNWEHEAATLLACYSEILDD